MNEDEKWMKIAINEANLANNENEIPVGAVLIKNGKIIAKAHNQPISKNDPTAHAEIQVLRLAGKKLENYRLTNTILYVTLEPCQMCFGAMMHARVKRIVYGADDTKKNKCGTCEDLKNTKHQIEITSGILQNDCSEILKKFFNLRR
tara:strand:- start:2023 stop:2463 length:441 start_codon:yes stop_codon:yes gene_type:complete